MCDITMDDQSTSFPRNRRILQNANSSAILSSMQAISFRDRSVSHDTAVHGTPFMYPAVKREYVSVRPRRKDTTLCTIRWNGQNHYTYTPSEPRLTKTKTFIIQEKKKDNSCSTKEEERQKIMEEN